MNNLRILLVLMMILLSTSCRLKKSNDQYITDFSDENLGNYINQQVIVKGYSEKKRECDKIKNATGNIFLHSPKKHLDSKYIEKIVIIKGKLVKKTKTYWDLRENKFKQYDIFELNNYKIISTSPLDISKKELYHGPYDIKKDSLAYFAKTNNLSKVKMLLKKGANPNVMIGKKSLLIFCLTYYETINPQIIQLLIKYGANPNATYDDSNALMFTDNIETIKMLIEHGVDINYKDQGGRTVLMSFCCSHGETYEIVKLLIKNKADINSLTENNETALDYAADSGDNRIAILLKKHGAKTGAEILKEQKQKRAIGSKNSSESLGTEF